MYQFKLVSRHGGPVTTSQCYSVTTERVSDSEYLDAKSDRVQMALNYAKENLRSDLSVGYLAEAAGLSPRQFSRVFREATGESPRKAVIARETGFGDRDRMRLAFVRAFGKPPQALQRTSGRTS